MMMGLEGKKVVVNLVNGYVYSGRCISEDEHSMVLIDKFDEEVHLSKSAILSVSGVRS